MMKRWMSLLLVLCMLLSMAPAVGLTGTAEAAGGKGNPFYDVSESAWYYEPVLYVYRNGIFSGITNRRFGPEESMTRAMFVTVLGRLAGVDTEAYEGQTVFEDVPAGQYYSAYVAWAAKHGIVKGMTETQFGPDLPVTREQMATFFIRYLQIFEVDHATGQEISGKPGDLDAVSDYAREAVEEFWELGLLSGDGEYFNPKQQAQRSHVAALCQRLDAVVRIWYKEPGIRSDREKVELEEGGGTLLRPVVTFVTNGGPEMEKVSVAVGTKIADLAVPYREGYVFMGWYYDEALTELAEQEDGVRKSLTLYAGWVEQTPLDDLQTPNFVAAENVGTDFAVTVLASDPALTAEDVLVAIRAEDLTDPEAQELLTVTGENGSFIVSGNGGFKEGGTYRITLNSAALRFDGQEESIRQYNFTVRRDEVMNLTMQGDIKYLRADQVSDIVNNGQRVDSLDLALYQSNGETLAVTELSTGSFVYTAAALRVGNTVCIYEGEIPTARTKETPAELLGDMAYLNITGAEGTVYQYESAEAEDVLFVPDVLPMPAEADTDTQDGTVTVEQKYLDYSGDIYAYMNLDSQTTADAGDFLAFYTGDLEAKSDSENAAALTGYGRITAVEENGDGTATISYVTVTWEEVESCMDVYAQEAMSAQQLLAGMDAEQMAAEIEQQAYASGFAGEAAQYLTALALSAENFAELSQMRLADYSVELEPGAGVSPEQLKAASGGGVEVEIQETSVKAKIGTKPTHLGNISGTSADEKGISITLDVEVVFTVATADSEGCLEITVTGSFVEEVGVDFGVSADAVWDKAVSIPYISDIKVSANVDTMNYTAVSFNATLITKEKEEEDPEDDGDDDDNDLLGDAMDIADEIKGWLEYLSEGGQQSDEFQDQLVERYSEMLSAESDWIRIVEYNIVEISKSVPFGIPLINLSFTVDFVVDLDASISVGFDFEYIEGKRHVFTVEIRDRKVYSDTIDLQEKTYQFCFYSMGRIALKAGVEMRFGISVISEKLGSVGFDAAAGAYTDLRGYFYYELYYSESQGKTQHYNGALLIEVGVYLNLGLEAQALSKYSARINLLDKQWKLYEAGRRDNVLDFVLQQEDMPEFVMKQFVKTLQLPDQCFNMAYLDLLTGEAKSAIYNNWNDPEKAGDFRNGENFTVTMSNPKFTYDPKTNTVHVHPDEDDLELEGEMIITWKKQPMSFSSKPIQRKISLHWDNYRDGYLIVPYTNGGSYVPLTVERYGVQVVQPEDPTRLGYTFSGWYSDEALTVPYTFPETMPAEDANVYAAWQPRTDIPYAVEHYLEDFRSGEYQLAEVETFTGTTDSYVTPAVKQYTGYVSPAGVQLKVEADGSAVLRYYYALERHNVTFDAGQVDGVDVIGETDVTYNLKYGASISAPHMAAKGYTFLGWTENGTDPAEIAAEMGTEDLTYTAMWEKNQDTEYRIEFYVQQSDGRYTLQHMIRDTAATGTVFTEEYLRSLTVEGKTADETYQVENAIVFENVTVKGIVSSEAVVDGSGKTVIKVNYGRIKHKLTFDPNYEGAEPIVKDVFYGAEVIVPMNVTRTGYTFAGWEVTPAAVMPAESLTYRAVWKANAYTVSFEKDHPDATGDMEDMSFVYDEAQKLNALGFARTHYDFAGWALQSAGEAKFADGESVKNLVAADGGSITLYALWTPTAYTISYEARGGSHSNPTGYHVESDTITLTDAARIGYTFGGWFDNAECTGEAVTEIPNGSGGDRTLYALWIPNSGITYKAEHYQQQLDGSYALTDTDEYTGTTEELVTPALKDYIGFNAPEAQTEAVLGDGSLVIVYRYTRNSYTLTFDAAGGEVTPESITARYGEAITLPVPERAGYGFQGWFNGEDAFAAATMGAEDLELTALWEAGKIGYTVNYHLQNVDGEGYTVFQTVSGTADMDSEVTPPIEIYEGFTSPEEEITITIKADAKENVVDYYYERNQYTLSWDLGIGSAEGQSYTEGTVYYGAPVTAPVPVKTGYSFRWNVTPVTSMSAEDLAYTAIWTANDYKVSFDLNGGTAVSGDTAARQVTFDTAYGELAVMEKTGYIFLGWFDGDTEITAETVLSKDADHVLTAKYERITYTLTYEGVLESEHTNPAEYNIEQTFALTAPSRTGYTFLGWFADEDFSGEAVTKIEKGEYGNKVFFAAWQENTYPVTFHAGNGTAEEQTGDYLFTATLPESPFTRLGYSFVGWSDGDQTYPVGTCLTQLVTADTAELHLTAAWEIQKYAITYVDVAADGHDNTLEYTVEDTVSISDPFDRAGYTFRGWFDNADFEGSAVETITIGSTGAKIFYALWEENTYTAQLNANDGTGSFITTEPTLYTGNLPANTFERTGYTFKGWTDGANTYGDLAAIADIIGTANGDNQVTLSAVWEINKYTIKYVDPTLSSDQQTTTATYTVEETVTLADPVEKADTNRFRFAGWYTIYEAGVFGGDKAESIPMGTTGEKTYYAKWEDAGSFSVVCLASAAGPTTSASYNATFRVVRDITDGAVPSTETQSVYVRTQNGTAYGATTSGAEDRYHFVHYSNIFSFTLADGDGSYREFSVTERDSYLSGYATASYQIGSKARNYYVEIYNVVNDYANAGGLVSVGKGSSVTRTMPVASYNASDVYRWMEYSFSNINNVGTDQENAVKVSKKPHDAFNGVATGAEEGYRDIVSSQYAYRVTMQVQKSAGSRILPMFRIYHDGSSSSIGCYQPNAITNSNWNSFSMPNMGKNAQGSIVFDKNSSSSVVENYSMQNESGTKSIIIPKNTDVKISFWERCCDEGSRFNVRNLKMQVKVYDKSKPTAYCAAPLATTDYKAGDTAYITVIYNEPLKTVGSPSLNIASSQLGKYFKDATYVNNGAGTNALVFRVTATRDITTQEIQNNVNSYLNFPVSNVGGNFSSNIGNLSATVTDVLGN